MSYFVCQSDWFFFFKKILKSFPFFFLPVYTVKRRSLTIKDVTSKEDNVAKKQHKESNNGPIMLPLIDAQLENEPIIHVIGWEGTRTLLPCNVSLNNHYHNDSIDLILWFRGQEQRALYSIDARRTSTMQRAKHFTGDDMLGSRAFIDLSTRPSSLIIDSVKSKYHCKICLCFASFNPFLYIRL